MLLKIALVFAAFFSASAASAKCNNCNVILISLDTVGAKHLSLYGAKAQTTPQLDKFAQKARVFNNAYAPAPWTLASHAAMLTGRLPWNVFGNDLTGVIPAQETLLAETLRQAGYKTAAFTDGFYLSALYGFHRGFDIFETPNIHGRAKPREFINPLFAELDLKIDRSIEFISKAGSSPYFLFIHSFAAHEPHLPSKQAYQKFSKHTMPPLGFSAQMQKKMNAPGYKPTAEEAEVLLALYQAGISEIDSRLGRFFQKLEEKKALSNTIVIVTADHGQEIGEHGAWGVHGFQYYEEVLKVPLVYYAPGTTAKRINSPVSLVDIVPTVLNDVGVEPPTSLDGTSLPEVDSRANSGRMVFAYRTVVDISRVLLLGDNQFNDTSKPFIHLFKTTGAVKRPINDYVAIKKNEKLILGKQKSSLTKFDLKADPDERRPLEVRCSNALCETLEGFIFQSGVLK